jgi:hypothetical protein
MNYAWHPCTPKQYKMVKAVENEQQAAVREEQQEQQRRCDLKVWKQTGAATRTNTVASSSGTAASNREIISQYTRLLAARSRSKQTAQQQTRGHQNGTLPHTSTKVVTYQQPVHARSSTNQSW